MSAFIFALFTFLAGALATYFFKRRLTVVKDHIRGGIEIPGLQPSDPNLGNLPELYAAGSLHQFLLRLRGDFGDVASFWFGPQPCVSISNGKLFREVLHLFDRPPIFFQFFEPLITKRAIPFANGGEGQRRHRILSECFNAATSANLMPAINKICEEFVSRWESIPENQHISLQEEMMALAVKNITTTHFGAYFRNENSAKIDDFQRIYHLVWNAMESQLVGSFPADDQQKVKEFRANTEALQEVCRDILRQHKKARESGDYEQAPFLNALIDNAADEDEELADCIAFVVGGFHTTGTSLTWMLYFLSHHPDVQDKVMEELNDVLDGGSVEVDAGNMKKLKYLRQVIDETFRLSVLAPYAGRVSDRDLSVGGRIVPAGTAVLIGLGAALQDESFFPEPDRFNPNRFAGGPGSLGPAFSPFGLGLRRCPGYTFAYHEIFCAAAAVLSRFKILPVSPKDVDRVYGLVTRPKDDIWIKIQKQNK